MCVYVELPAKARKSTKQSYLQSGQANTSSRCEHCCYKCPAVCGGIITFYSVEAGSVIQTTYCINRSPQTCQSQTPPVAQIKVSILTQQQSGRSISECHMVISL